MPKKTKKAEKEEQDVFYVGIKDPIEIRRSILESSREVVQYLQRAERFRATRAEKGEQIAKLRSIMNEIHSLVRKLRAELPKTNLRVKMHKHEEVVVKEEAAAKKTEERKAKESKAGKKEIPAARAAPAAKSKESSELEKLEAELGEIESRLTRVG